MSGNQGLHGEALPKRITVRKSVSSRYQAGTKPVSWDERSPGVETVETITGENITLVCSGGQGSPAPGWELMLTNKTREGYEWTLFGIQAQK